MKKYAIAIIGLMFAALVFGACEIKKGGTIEVTNGSNTNVVIIVGKFLSIPDTTGVEAAKPNETKSFTFDDDGVYTVYSFFNILTPQTETVSLIGGETRKITVKP